MAEPFIAEIRIFAGNFAPRGWALCNGQLLPISQNTALFALIGTTYGGDGRTTTALPDLQGRAPMHPGNGPGLSERRLGQQGGTTTETITTAQMPSHTHTLTATSAPGDDNDPGPTVTLATSVEGAIYEPAQNLVPMANESLLPAGGGGAHNNLQPYLAMNFIIALVGFFPSRS